MIEKLEPDELRLKVMTDKINEIIEKFEWHNHAIATDAIIAPATKWPKYSPPAKSKED